MSIFSNNFLSIWILLHSVFGHDNFWNTDILRGCVAICMRCGRIYSWSQIYYRICQCKNFKKLLRFGAFAATRLESYFLNTVYGFQHRKRWAYFSPLHTAYAHVMHDLKIFDYSCTHLCVVINTVCFPVLTVLCTMPLFILYSLCIPNNGTAWLSVIFSEYKED